jgi:uncharacterized membrane protein
MAKNDIASVRFYLKNNSSESICVSLEGITHSSRISAEPRISSICLNPNEQSSVMLDIETSNASASSYTVKLKARFDGRSSEASVRVSIAAAFSGVEIDTAINDVCRGRVGSIELTVKNTTSAWKEVKLNASSDVFTAWFSTSRLELEPYQARTVTMYFYTYPNTSLGEHTITVRANVGSQQVSATARFNVVDCGAVTEQKFELVVPEQCISVSRDMKKTIEYTIINKSSRAITVNVQPIASIPASDSRTVQLRQDESKQVSFWVKPRNSDALGEHTVELLAWTEDQRVRKNVCVKVEGTRKSGVELLDKSLTVAQGMQSVAILRVNNLGDFAESFTIKVNNPTNAQITLSEESFTLDPNSSKDVFINVNVPIDMEPDSYTIDIITENEKVWRETLELYVSPYEEPAPEPQPPAEIDVQIMSWPSQVQSDANTTRSLHIVITNLSDQPTGSLTVELTNMPAEITLKRKRVYLSPNETKVVEVELTVGVLEKGYYKGKLVLKSDGVIIDEKAVEVYVREMEKEEPAEKRPLFTSILAALIVPEGLGWWLLALFLIAFLTILIITGILIFAKEKVPVWARRV